MIVEGDSAFDNTTDTLPMLRLPLRYQLPTIHSQVDGYAARGGLMAYSPDVTVTHRRPAAYVDKILSGACPGELRVEEATDFEFDINLSTARSLGLMITEDLLVQATQAPPVTRAWVEDRISTRSVRRRELARNLGLATLFLVAGCGIPPNWGARDRVPKIGFLGSGVSDQLLDEFRQGLGDVGLRDGENVLVQYTLVDGPEKFPSAAAELIRQVVDLIIAVGTSATIAAKTASSTVPIVALEVTDLVQSGLAVSMAHPGSNVTGLTTLSASLAGKRLELLRDLNAGLIRVAVFWNAVNAGLALQLQQMQEAAQELGVVIQPLGLRGANDLDSAFASALQQLAQAIVVLPSPPVPASDRSRFVDFARQSRLPAIYPYAEMVSVLGGLMSYGPGYSAMYRRAGTYVDKILKGGVVGDIPIEQPTTFDLVLNLSTARELGMSIPQSILVQATQVVP